MPSPFKGKSLAELDEKVRKLVLSKLGKEGKTEKGPKRSWIQPHDAKRLLQAMDNPKQTHIILATGHMLIKHKPHRDAIFVCPAEGFLPCAWISREGLQKIITEDEAGV